MNRMAGRDIGDGAIAGAITGFIIGLVMIILAADRARIIDTFR